jgi:hypothetical protein
MPGRSSGAAELPRWLVVCMDHRGTHFFCGKVLDDSSRESIVCLAPSRSLVERYELMVRARTDGIIVHCPSISHSSYETKTTPYLQVPQKDVSRGVVPNHPRPVLHPD